MTATALQIAISKVSALPEDAQEQIGREMLERIAHLEALRTDVEIGLAQLDAGHGCAFDVEAFIARARAEHAKG